MNQQQRLKCAVCKGTGQVGLLRGGPRLFQFMYNRPMQVPVVEARGLLLGYKGDDAGAMTMLVRNLGDAVVGTICRSCGGGGEIVLTFGEPIRD